MRDLATPPALPGVNLQNFRNVNPSNSLESLTRDRGATAPKPARRFPAWLVPLALIAGFGLLFLAMFRDRLLPAPDVRVARVVTTPEDSAATGEIHASAPEGTVLFQASGWIEPDPFPIRATALVDGVVETVTARDGQLVKQDELLASLIDTDARLAIERAKQNHQALVATRAAHVAAIESARQRLAGAQAELMAAATLKEEAADRVARFGSMHRNAVPESEVVSARLRVDRETAMATVIEAAAAEQEAEIRRLEVETSIKDAEIGSAKVELEQAELTLSRTRITAPINGRVLRILATPGQKKMLQDNEPESSTIAILYDPESLQVRVDVPLADAAGLEVGQAVKIRSSLLPDRVFRGEVTRITGEADIQRNTLQAKVRIIDPIDKLRPEMLCRVEFLGGSTKSSPSTRTLATWIPQGALDNGHVWLCNPESKRVSKREVKPTSDSRDGFTRVTGGVNPGDWVVISPRDLADGRRVNPTLVNQP